MQVYKLALVILPSTYILTLCSRASKDNLAFDIILTLMYLTSSLLGGRIIYDRYKKVDCVSSVVSNSTVILFANKIASFTASFLFLGFLVWFLFLLQVDEYCITALKIFAYGLGTLYVWMQSIITNCTLSFHYNKRLNELRQCLANLCFVILVVMTVFGIITTFLPRGATNTNNGVYICRNITTGCSYIMAAIFCIVLLTFEKDNMYFDMAIKPDLLLDDSHSFNNPSLSEVDSYYPDPSTNLIKGDSSRMKIS